MTQLSTLLGTPRAEQRHWVMGLLDTLTISNDPPETQLYRFVKFILTGKNESNKDSLIVSQFEVFVVIVASTKFERLFKTRR
jgi:hypothetical protein